MSTRTRLIFLVPLPSRTEAQRGGSFRTNSRSIACTLVSLLQPADVAERTKAWYARQEMAALARAA